MVIDYTYTSLMFSYVYMKGVLHTYIVWYYMILNIYIKVIIFICEKPNHVLKLFAFVFVSKKFPHFFILVPGFFFHIILTFA